MSVLDHALDHPAEIEEHATVPLAGGIANYGYQCGMLWGAILAAGAQAYRLYGPGPQAEAEAIMAAQRIVESFRAHAKNEINCLEITDMNFKGKIQPLKLLKFFIKGGPVGCVNMSVKYSREAFGEINSALSETHTQALSAPVSCAAMLAQKMGASEKHTVMVAGLAGGIGFSGGGCGALGAAIWINAMKDIEEGDSIKVHILKASDIIDKFIRSANFELECYKIVGRNFEDITDHANYLRKGGCAEIIEALVAKSPEK